MCEKCKGCPRMTSKIYGEEVEAALVCDIARNFQGWGFLNLFAQKP